MAVGETHYDDEWEDDTSAEFFDGLTVTPNPIYPGSSKGDYDYAHQDEEPVVMSSRVDGPRDMWGQEIIALVKNTVETHRRALEASLASSGLTGDAASQTKLTIQLKSQGLSYFPSEAVELLKPDVERLVLAHNSIPSVPNNFGELQGLTFLNVRANKMREFPKAFLKLSRLQMLDISRNELQKIPDQIDQMKSLKVLSASGNRLESVPNTLGSLQALKILKIDNNPLNIYLKRVIDGAGGFGTGASHPPQQTEHELNLTQRIKEFLRNELSSQESGDSSEGPLETPRPLRRNNSIRFPVAIPGLSGSESTPDLTSPSSQRTFSRSHQRVISGASGPYSASRQRQGVAQLLMNDRNRSNSEGIPSSNHHSGPKKLALPLKQAQELELANNRNSLHLRGVSHGSALKDRPPTVRGAIRNQMANSSAGADAGYAPGDSHQYRRLSSLPEAELPDIPGYPSSGVQACKGLLYSLHQVHVYIGTQPNIVRQGTPKRSSLERVYYNARTHLQNLDELLFAMHAAAEEDDQVRESVVRHTREAGRSCIIVYKQVLDLMSRGAELYLAQTDPRFVRTFMHTLYASIIEAINSAANLRRMIEEEAAPVTTRNKYTMPKEQVPRLTVRQTTPIKDKPRNITTRLRSDTFNRAGGRWKSSSNPYSAVPLYLNNGRSRSNSRGMAGGPPSASSSLTGTPRSGESFFIPQSPGLPTPAQDYNPIATADFANQDLPFEAVFNELVRAVRDGMMQLPGVHSAFRANFQKSIETRAPKSTADIWSKLGYESRNCHERCEQLRARLAAVKLKDLEVRRSSEFWSYATRYMNAFVRLMDTIKSARHHVVVEPHILRALKPVHKAVKEAVSTMQNSPWAHFLENTSPSISQSRAGSHMGSPAHSRQHSKDTPPHQAYGGADRLRTTGLGVSNVSTSNGNLSARARGDSETSLSPFAMGMPQTPLSAALGPAAQATIPTSAQIGTPSGTPPKTSFDTSFRGDVFERADTLLRSHSVVGHRR